MRTLSTIVLFSLLLVACSSSDSSRYRDNADLERPPELPINKQAAEQIAANQIEAPKRRYGKGLKSDVYRDNVVPSELKIKRSFDESWSLLHQAIQHNEIKVTDQDRSKGFYYVAYNGASFFNKATSFFDNERNQPTYLLKVDSQGDETRVVANLAVKEEQSTTAGSKNGRDTNSEDKSEQLIELLYDTLHDVVKDE